MKKPETIYDLCKKEDIVHDMQTKYGKRVALVRSKNYSESKRYTKWANEVVKNFFKMDRALLDSGECNFSYIKFAKNKKGETFAIVAGVSQFHKRYTSDICFYNIKKIRKKQNISQKQLAEHLKISQQAVSYIENGITDISSQKMRQICKFLKSDILEVFPEMNVMSK